MAVAQQPNLEHMSPEEVLAFMVERFHPRLYVACSFQKEASVIMDMLLRIEPEARFFTLDTGLFFPETYATWRALEERYGVTIEVYQGMSLAPEGRPARRRAVEPRSRCLLRHTQGGAAQAGAVAGRRLDHRGAAGAVDHPPANAQAAMGRQARALEGQPARRLERARRLALHLQARRPLQQPPRPRLRLDRLYLLHLPRRFPRGPLGGTGKTECGLH